MQNDPIKQIEDIVKSFHDRAEKYTTPVLSRYPLLFSFLVIFSAGAIIHGFELVADQIGLFQEKPYILILIGIVMLLLTGMLYKSLDRMK